ncbi:MAG: ATP-binding protein [Oscillospiraceae bacterium]
MNRVTEARLYLSSLTIYRKILEDNVIASFLDLLRAAEGCDLQAFAGAYGEFYSRLSDCSDDLDLSSHLEGLVRYDDNAFSRTAAARLPTEGTGLMAAARRDLSSLHKAISIKPEEIKAEVKANFSGTVGASEFIDGLPGFSPVKGLFAQGIEAALESAVAFYRENGCGPFARYGAFKWYDGGGAARLSGITNPDPVRLCDLKGYEYERGVVVRNTLDFLEGSGANNLLLYGDRGTGKSSTVKAAAREYRGNGLRIIEVSKDYIKDFPLIVNAIRNVPLKFILFIDDLSFSSDDAGFSALKSVLEGGISSRPENCLIYATSNRRHLVKESFSERDGDDVHAGDTMQEKLSLADRFGITVTFSAPDQKLYIQIISALAHEKGFTIPDAELERGAIQWALRSGGRSPRAARQYIEWAQSRLKKGLPVTDF